MDKNRFLVIMAGGAGTRFWPCSRSNRPKQFLDFFGTGRSLLQQTFDRFAKILPTENIFIASNKQYKDLILEQLPMLKENQLLLEPARRNTAPCIAYAMNKIAALNPNANVVIAPSDHLVLKEQEFVDTIEKGLNFTAKNDVLMTLGIKPSRPETGYGYIQIENNASSDSIFKVKTFTEKPNLELAQIFFESDEFLWNSGMFIWNAKAISNAFEQHEPEIWDKFKAGSSYYNTPKEQEYIDSIYQTSKNLSIDYAIMEKAQNVNVIAADFGWSDLGTWGSLYDLSDSKDENKNATLKGRVKYHNSKGNVISLAENKIAIIEGLDDMIVVDDDNVLLICRKSEEQHIRDYVSETKEKFGEDYI